MVASLCALYQAPDRTLKFWVAIVRCCRAMMSKPPRRGVAMRKCGPAARGHWRDLTTLGLPDTRVDRAFLSFLLSLQIWIGEQTSLEPNAEGLEASGCIVAPTPPIADPVISGRKRVQGWHSPFFFF